MGRLIIFGYGNGTPAFADVTEVSKATLDRVAESFYAHERNLLQRLVADGGWDVPAVLAQVMTCTNAYRTWELIQVL